MIYTDLLYFFLSLFHLSTNKKFADKNFINWNIWKLVQFNIIGFQLFSIYFSFFWFLKVFHVPFVFLFCVFLSFHLYAFECLLVCLLVYQLLFETKIGADFWKRNKIRKVQRESKKPDHDRKREKKKEENNRDNARKKK